MPLDLKPGANRIEYTGIAAHVEPDSVILRDPAGRALQILEQNYRNDPVSQELLLSFYEGKTIDFLGATPDSEIDQGQDRSQRLRAQLQLWPNDISSTAYSQPIVEVDGVLRFGLPGPAALPRAEPGLNSQAHARAGCSQTNKPG